MSDRLPLYDSPELAERTLPDRLAKVLDTFVEQPFHQMEPATLPIVCDHGAQFNPARTYCTACAATWRAALAEQAERYRATWPEDYRDGATYRANERIARSHAAQAAHGSRATLHGGS